LTPLRGLTQWGASLSNVLHLVQRNIIISLLFFTWVLIGVFWDLGIWAYLGVLALVFSLSLALSFGSFYLMSLELSFWSFGFVFMVWLIGNAILKAQKPDPNV